MSEKHPNLAAIITVITAFVAFVILGVCWLCVGGSPAGLFGIGGAVASTTSQLIRRRPPGDHRGAAVVRDR